MSWLSMMMIIYGKQMKRPDVTEVSKNWPYK
jgi:hypothetical protein